MRCKYCGGEINLSVGRCITCGRAVDSTSDIRILHDLGSIAEQYGLDPDLDKYDLPLYTAPEPDAEEPQISAPAQIITPPQTFDLKQAVVPGIELGTYYELLGYDPSEETDADVDMTVSLSEPEESDVSYEAYDDSLIELSGEDNDASEESEIFPEDAFEEEDDEQNEHRSWIRDKAELLIDRIDHITEPVTERVRQWYNSKLPQMNRAITSSKSERLAVICALAAAVILVVGLTCAIIAAIPESVIGEWQVSEDDANSLLTVEFTKDEVIARVYDEDGEAHIYRRGVYKTSHSNGRDLLTIEYEDGTLSNLYFELSGKTGEFVNVGTGTSATYKLIN